MRFESLWYLLLLPLFLLFLRKKKQFIYFPFLPFVKTLPKTSRVYINRIIPWLRYLALFLIVIALVRPQKVDEKVRKFSEGIDIMMLLDISESMKSEDFKPKNRLGVAKNVISDFVKGRTSDRIGLIVFSGESYTKCPLTVDYDILNKRIDEVDFNDGSVKHGTAIGMAITNGVARLKNSNAKSKIMVLLTDGENNTGTIDPITASELANDENIKIYSVAIGKDGKVPFPVQTSDFFGRSVKRYTYIHNKIDTEIFKIISKNTNGNFFRATDSKALVKIFRKINKLEKTKVHVNKIIRVKDYFPVFLKIALILLLLELFLSEFIIRRLPV